jgi:hypothetical protein
MPPAPPPPPLPPNIDLLKPTPQLAIVALWATMIQEANDSINGGTDAQGQPIQPSPVAGLIDPQSPDVLNALSMRAHFAEHRLRMAMGGASTQPAPPPGAPAPAPPAQ